MIYLGGFLGFIIGVVVGAPAGILVYWYLAIHRKKIPAIPTDIPKINIG